MLKIYRVFIILLLFNPYVLGYSQTLITKIPATSVFNPTSEEVESPKEGIIIYDQYCSFNESPSVRYDGQKAVLNGKKTDNYSNGLILHSGDYQNGILNSFTNYYQNGSIERKYKSKGSGTGELECFYLNGYYRSLKKLIDFKVYELEEYYDNGVLAHTEVKDKKSFYPTTIVDQSYSGQVINTIEISDKKALMYIQTIFLPNGKKIEEGELKYLPETDEFIHEGVWITYDKKEQQSSHVIYENGNVKEIVEEKRPTEEVVYYSYEKSAVAAITENVSVANSNNNSSGQNSGDISSTVPERIRRFDKNSDNFISNKEVDMAVSDFFEDDTITKDQINELVNFFFEQE